MPDASKPTEVAPTNDTVVVDDPPVVPNNPTVVTSGPVVVNLPQPPAPPPLFEIEKPKVSWIWLKDSDGKPSVSVTFAFVAFWVTTLTYLISTVEKIGNFEIRAFDVAACSTYMVPILGLYFGRRYTTAKFEK